MIPGPAVSPAAVGDGRRALSSDGFARAVDAAAHWLAARRPQALGILLDNGIEWLIADLAAQAAGIVTVPLPAFFTARQIQAASDAAGVDLLLVPGERRLPGWAGAAGNPLPASAALARDAGRPEFPAGTAKITFTSGTTGAPKGVCLSAAQQWKVARALVQATADLGIERHLCLLPLAVLLENLAGAYAPMLAGAAIVAPPLADVGMSGAARLDVPRMLAAIARYRPHSVILLPQMLKAWVAALEAGASPPVDLRFAAVGGGRVAPELIGRARRLGLPVFEGYGLSECASVVSLNTPAADRPGSVGRVLPHVRVELAADGEILIAGNTFLGYLGAGAPPPARLATGDLGRLDAEGFLHVTGRKKNVIITSFGRNVSPEWPEAELAARPQIAQAAVFGEARPCCVAVLVPAEPGLADADLQRAVDAANRALPDYARIGAWVRAGAPFSAAAGTATANGRLRRDAIWEIHGAALAELDPASGEPA